MRQLMLPGDLGGRASSILDSKTSRYLGRVLRMGSGDTFSAIDEKGNRFSCSILDGNPRAMVISLNASAAPIEAPQGAITPIALVQALPKGAKMDLIIRQATEAGVSVIIPAQTKNCVAKEREDREDRRDRRMKIVREAIQQSGSSIQTRVTSAVLPAELPDLLEAEGFPVAGSLRLMFHELPLAKRSLHEYCAGEPLPTVILIGPEGGFTSEETGEFRDMGFEPAHFEGPILRTETASLYALAAVKTLLLERAKWTLSK